jgi:Xaa-Pro aminopeptidase
MEESKLDALFVTSEANYRYLTGFDSQFWTSPTRPWYFVLPLDDEPTVVVPETGLVGIKTTSWVSQIKTWPSPRPSDDGVTLVADVLKGIRRRTGRVGAEIGVETRLGMPVADFLRLSEMVAPIEVVDGSSVLRRLRMVKSPAEIEKIRTICIIASQALDRVPGYVDSGATERTVYRQVQLEAMRKGADHARYLTVNSGPGGYPTPIMGPTDRALRTGDVLYMDAGFTYDAYFCDFNRNWAVGEPSAEARRVYELLYQATERGMQAAKPGALMRDIWKAMADHLKPVGDVGVSARLGHGLGLHITEPPSLSAVDETAVEVGMVLTIEPGVEYGPGHVMLHEEDVVVTRDGAQLLTPRAPATLPVIPK